MASEIKKKHILLKAIQTLTATEGNFGENSSDTFCVDHPSLKPFNCIFKAADEGQLEQNLQTVSSVPLSHQGHGAS